MIVEFRTRDHIRLMLVPASIGLQDEETMRAATGCECANCIVIRQAILDAARRLIAMKVEGRC